MLLKLIFGNPLENGTKAPEFQLPDQTGKVHKLSDYLGKWLVLYFYPKDNTKGCTAEACSFRDEFQWFRENQITILGVSTDGVESHQAFASTHKLPFPILADASHQTSKNYGILAPLGIAHRVTFLIDPKGVIVDRIEWANWSRYAESVKKRFESLPQFTASPTPAPNSTKASAPTSTP